MTRNFVRVRALGLGGLWFLLGACEGTISDGRPGGAAGALHAADAGAQPSDAGADDGGASGSDSSSAASAMNVEPDGSGGKRANNGHGGKHGSNPAMNDGGTSDRGASGHSDHGGASGYSDHGGASGYSDHGGASGYSDNGGEAAVREVMIPCDVYAAYSVCRNCHIDPPVDGAPMPLLTLQDLQSNAGSAYLAIQTGLMPKAGTLAPQDAALILAWLASGAQGVPKEACP